MVSCKLQGGIGNVFFQCAAAISLALKHNDVAAFSLESDVPLQGHVATKYRHTLLKNLNVIYTYQFQHYYSEPQFPYQEIPYKKDLLLHGYFQSEKYFKKHEKEIREIFALEPIPDFPYKDYTAVHVRRGDYQKNPHIFPLCTKEYYYEGMSICGGPFIFFSDDLEWVRNNFVGNNITYSPYDNEELDLRAMGHCKNVIGANSSFSWWSSYLNVNPHAVRIFPKKWFEKAGPDPKDICPETWIRI